MKASHQPQVTSHQLRDVRAALKEAMAQLRAGNVPSHTLAAELLLMHTLGRDRAWLYAHPEEMLGAAASEKYLALVAQRIAGTPTQYLTGKQEFWGLEIAVEPGVFIPRPESELILEVALERLGPPRPRNGAPRGTGLRIADACTGSGCLAVALAHELPGAEIFATDISPLALSVARRNAARHAARVHLVQCRMLEPFLRGNLFDQAFLTTHRSPFTFDLVVCNPPYLGRADEPRIEREVRDHEPAAALFGGEHGSELYGPLVAQAARVLRPGGILVMELNYNSLERVRPMVDAWDAWTFIHATRDLAGVPRVIAAERR
jgi:release factor glutamine methyltransferase